jgi:hypothetical protein
VGFVVDKVALGQVSSPSSSVFPCQFLSTGAPLLGKGQKIIIIFIFIIGLHNKPPGCSASVASAAGPSPLKKSPSSVPLHLDKEFNSNKPHTGLRQVRQYHKYDRNGLKTLLLLK